jgi:hypothetical protein
MPEKLLSQGQTKLDANSLFLNDSHFSELQQSQNTINTHTHTFNYNKTRYSLAVTLSTLIHNKTTHQPTAVYPVITPHGQSGSTWLTTQILETHGKVRKDNNIPSKKHEREQMILFRTTVNEK